MSYVNCSPNGLGVRLAWLALLACIRTCMYKSGVTPQHLYISYGGFIVQRVALAGPMNVYARTLHGCSEPNGEPVWTAIHIRHAKICT